MEHCLPNLSREIRRCITHMTNIFPGSIKTSTYVTRGQKLI